MSNLYHVFGEHVFGEPNPNSNSDCEDEMYDGDECASRLGQRKRRTGRNVDLPTGIQLNNGQAVVDKCLESLKAAVAAENMDDANLASLTEHTIPDKVAYRPLCSLDGDDGAM